MAGLSATTARLAAMRRQFQALGSLGGHSATSPADLTEHRNFGANPGQLRMLTYAPEGLAAKAPLVVVLHGCRQDAAGYGGHSGWTALADRLGFAVLLPEQRSANNPNNCFNWFLPEDTARGSGEAASIRQMIDRAIAEFGSDPKQVFVTGLSAGGAMTSVMLATYPDVFAAGAIIAGLPYGVAGNVQQALDAMYQGGSRTPAGLAQLVKAASPHTGPWPRISIWHGSADQTVKPSNADEIEKQWTALHGLPFGPAEASKVDGQTRRVWRNGAGETVVESYTIAGFAHGTPVAAAQGAEGGVPGPFILEAGIASTLRIAEFWGLLEPAQAARPSAAANTTRRAPGQPPIVPFRGGASGPKSAPRPATPPQSQAEQPRAKIRPLGVDPQAVIEKALKAARLLKP